MTVEPRDAGATTGKYARAAGIGFVACAGRHASVDAVAWGLIVAAFLALIPARRFPRAAVAATVALELALLARGNGPTIAIGAVFGALTALHKSVGRRAVERGDVLEAQLADMSAYGVGFGVVAFLSLAPWLLRWPAEAVLAGRAHHHNPLITLLVLANLYLLACAGSELAALFSTSQERVQALESARDHAVEEERLRIARELHDVVAHQMSVVVAQAQGAEALVERDPKRVRRALTTISATSRDALVEMRRLVGVARSAQEDEPPEPEAPQPGLDNLDQLEASARASGLDVVMHVEHDIEVPPAVGLSAFRTIQESLTNAAKHAPGSAVRVDVTVDGDTLNVKVVNGRARRKPADVPGSGVGIIGMTERTKLFGGTLQAGRRPDGGWFVRASFPLTPVAP